MSTVSTAWLFFAEKESMKKSKMGKKAKQSAHPILEHPGHPNILKHCRPASEVQSTLLLLVYVVAVTYASKTPWSFYTEKIPHFIIFSPIHRKKGVRSMPLSPSHLSLPPLSSLRVRSLYDIS